MTVTDQTLTIYRGQDLVITETVTGVDITGWTLELTLRNRQTSTIDLTVAGVITNAGSGVATFTLTDTQTGTLTPGRYDFSIWRTNDGSENPLTTGTATVVRTSRE